eukprot:6204111-Pleurochrysis_carterae.AAC.2
MGERSWSARTRGSMRDVCSSAHEHANTYECRQRATQAIVAIAAATCIIHDSPDDQSPEQMRVIKIEGRAKRMRCRRNPIPRPVSAAFCFASALHSWQAAGAT